MYSFDARIRYSEVDENLRLTVPALLDYFEDAALFESENGRNNLEYLGKRHLAWVLSSWQIILKKMPRLGENVVISTFPYDFKGFIGYRNFTMTTKQGECIAKAASIWTLIDTQKMRPQRIDEELLKGYDLQEKLDMDYAPRKIDLLGEGTVCDSFTVMKHQIDSNHHMNNVAYIGAAMDYFPDNREISGLRAEFKSAALLNDTVVPAVYDTENKFQVKLANESGEVYAIVELTKL